MTARVIYIPMELTTAEIAERQSKISDPCCGRGCPRCPLRTFMTSAPDQSSRWCAECAATVYPDGDGSCPSCGAKR